MMQHILEHEWFTATSDDSFIPEKFIDNCVIEKILRNKFHDPLLLSSESEDESKPNIIDWDEIFSRPEKKIRKVVQGIHPVPHFPKLSTLSPQQHTLCLKVLCSQNPEVMPADFFYRPTKKDYRIFSELKEIYEKEQKEFIAWAKTLWTTKHCVRALRPKPIVETVYEAEFKVRAGCMQSFPKTYGLAGQISLDSTDECELIHQKDIIKVNASTLPLLQYPDMNKRISILTPIPTPEPCTKHPCRFVLPNEAEMTLLPLTEIHKELAQFALDNGATNIASESALRCLMWSTRHWELPVSVCAAITPEGDLRNVVVLGSEFCNEKETAPMRTYKAYKRLLEKTLIPPMEWMPAEAGDDKPIELTKSQHNADLSDDENDNLCIDMDKLYGQDSGETSSSSPMKKETAKSNKSTEQAGYSTANNEPSCSGVKRKNTEQVGCSAKRSAHIPVWAPLRVDTDLPCWSPRSSANIQSPRWTSPRRNNTSNIQSPGPSNIQPPGLTSPRKNNTSNIQSPGPSNLKSPGWISPRRNNTSNVQSPGPSNIQSPGLTSPRRNNTSIIQSPGPSNLKSPGWISPRRNNTSNVQAPGPSNLKTPGWISPRRNNTSNVQAPGPSNIQSPGLISPRRNNTSNIQAPGPSNIQSPGLTNPRRNNTSNIQAPGSSNIQSPGPSNLKSPGWISPRRNNTSNIQAPGPSNLKTPGWISPRRSNMSNIEQPCVSSKKNVKIEQCLSPKKNANIEQACLNPKSTRKKTAEEATKMDFYDCSCVDTDFERPPPRSYKRWRLRGCVSGTTHDLIIHAAHKARGQSGEVIVEPIPEYMIDVGASRAPRDADRCNALALMLRKIASVLNVRVDTSSGDIVTTHNLYADDILTKHSEICGEVAARVMGALTDLQGLRPGRYLLRHEAGHGDNALLYLAGGCGKQLALRLDCARLADHDEAKSVNTPPVLDPVLLPVHKHRRILPCAFSPYPNHVAREPKRPPRRQRTPPRALALGDQPSVERHKWPKKQKKKKKKKNNNQ